MSQENKTQLQVQKPSNGSSKNGIQTQELWTPEKKKTLAVVIGRVFDLQKQFGKTTGQLENIVEGFCWAMQVYSPDDVIRGFAQYILTSNDMPTPSDIVKIIDPKLPAWKPDKAYYITLKEIHKQNGPYGLSLDEIEYIGKYEDHMRMEMRASS